MTIGLPASGKSTWANQYVLDAPAGAVVRINKDTLRQMLHAGRWKGRKTESQIEAARDALIETFLTLGKSVIVDDTNFALVHQVRLAELATKHGATLRVERFETDVKTCIERDLKRPNSVGHKVINKMHMKYLAKPTPAPAHDPYLPDAIIVDIDGTLAHMNGRSPYDYTKVIEDTVDPIVRSIVMAEEHRGCRILVVSGRKASCLIDTQAWLNEHIRYDGLWMRAADDDRKDSIVKDEIFEREIAGKYNVRYVLDDRDQVVAMWRSKGLKVLQVADGDF